MDFKEEYKQKLVSADEAVKLIKSGDWVDYGWCTNTVDALDKALAKRTDELKDVKLRGGILMKPLAVFEREDAGEHFCWNSWHMSGIERKLASRGCAYYAPIRYSELPRYYRDIDCPDDVAMFQVAPMDAHGYFNFGPSASHLGAMCERAKHIIVEVNENMPRCLGGTECGIHISDVTYIVEGENPPIGELGAGGPATDVDKAVAKLIVDEIPNGACLQLGIGGMPNAVGSLIAESDLKDLGVHTEMYVDAFVDIAKAGKINGSKKNIDRYRQTYAFGAGTKKMYDYLDDNPELMSAPVDYFHQQRCGHRPLRTGQRGVCRHEADQRRRRTARLRARRVPFQRRQEFHLPVLHLQVEGWHGTVPHPSDARQRLRCHRRTSKRTLCRYRVRQGQLKGLIRMAESRVSDFHCAPGFP